MKKITTFLCVLVLISSISTYAQKTWTGATSAAWNTTTNWSPSGVPTASDNVIIPSAPANQPLISGTSTPVCNNLTVNSGATLTISATSLNNALLTVSGTATFNGILSIGGLPTKTGKIITVNAVWNSTSSLTTFYNARCEVSGDWQFSSGSLIDMGLCYVTFTGTSGSTITNYSAGSNFSSLTINKTGGGIVYIGSSSTSTLTITGGLTLGTGAILIGQPNITTILKGNLLNSGNIYMNYGTLSFEMASGTQIVQVNSGDYFNNLNINTGGTVTLNNGTLVKGSLTIQSGIFDPQNYTVTVQGDWSNTVGSSGFTEGTGRVIFNGGNYHQYCSSETFNILEINKSLGGAFRVNGTTITCTQYDWTAGAIDVLNNGTFTALDLADQGIRGNYYLNTGCTINLYQDASQYVDLGGNLTFTGGGTINVYGGNGTVSQWPTYANASITMSGGTLDFKDQSITINSLSGYTLTTNITGGTIRTSRDFFNSRSDFNPAGGTIEMVGSTNNTLSLIAGSLWSLKIDKDPSNTVTTLTNLIINGGLTVETGTLSVVNKIVTLASSLSISWDGVFHLGANGQLQMASGKYLYVNNGGTLKTEGTVVDNAIITHSAGYYFIVVQNNGTVSAKYTYFQYMNTINFQSGSFLDPANAFYKCTFTNNSAAYSSMLIFANTQEISIHEANFPTLYSSYSVNKPNNAGHLYFKDATGAYAGETYENDPYNLIDWTTETPGLWTGVASSDWFNTNNWDNYGLPTANTSVIIPAGTLFSPVIGSGNAYCYNLEVAQGASLAQTSGNFNVYGDFDLSSGQFHMTGTSYLNFAGSINVVWRSSSSYNTYTNVRIIKDNSESIIQTYGTFLCNGTFRIIEGILNLSGYLTISNSGSEAFWVESGGKINMGSLPSSINVDGNVTFEGGSFAEVSQGYFGCAKDFTVGPGSDVSFSGGILSMTGSGTQYIDNQSGGNFEICIFSIAKAGGICYIKSGDLKIKGLDSEVSIHGGTLSCNNGPSPTATYNIYVEGDWDNSEGPEAFEESSGSVIFNGLGTSFCPVETFNILVVDKGVYGLKVQHEVTCAAYDWTSGSVYVDSGRSFTASDLLDNAIKGSFICEEGGTINLTNSGTGTFVDLAGELHNFGGTINISGSISYWPYGGDAVVEMTGGVIDLKTCGLTIYNTGTYSLNDNITGGTIRTAYGFAGNRSDFIPGAGTFEFYGSPNATISQSNGSSLHDIVINKSAKQEEKSSSSEPIFDERSGIMVFDGGKSNLLTLNSDLLIKGNLSIQSGQLSAEGYTIDIKGDWNNEVGPDGFLEGTGRVIFSAGYMLDQHCSSEEFNILEINKNYSILYSNSGSDISCQVYDWTQGTLKIIGNSNFYAWDLADNAILGNYVVGASYVEIHQDGAQGIDFIGAISLIDGEMKVFGGNDVSKWGTNGNAVLVMDNGILDFVDQGILIQEDAPYNFTYSTGEFSSGTIRTQKLFDVNSPGITVYCTIELYGEPNSMIYVDEGSSLGNLRIIKPPLPTFTNILSSTIVGYFEIESGTAIVPFGNTLKCDNIHVDDGGELHLTSSTLIVDCGIYVLSGGSMYTSGYYGAESQITWDCFSTYPFFVYSGGYISSNYTEFENLNNNGNGIYIDEGAMVDPYNSFNHCEFRCPGFNLNINTGQDLTIEYASFPVSYINGYNVVKGSDSGSLLMVNATGDFAGEEHELDPYNRINWINEKLDLKVWLEGPFNGADMNNGLTGSAGFPLSQPYHASPWNYTGTESVTSIPADVVDWVLVELRDAPSAAQATSGTRVARYAGFLLKDGSIVSTDGSTPLVFTNSINNQLYLVILHRNHLGIMSALPLVKSGYSYNYDFTTGIEQAYGSALGYKDWEPGVAMMVAGDGTADGNITPADKTNSWSPNAGKKGYFSGDFNMDTQVNNTDKNTYWWHNDDDGYECQVPD
jgi:hypothetical protein